MNLQSSVITRRDWRCAPPGSDSDAFTSGRVLDIDCGVSVDVVVRGDEGFVGQFHFTGGRHLGSATRP
ncbi:hypothetical protein J6590_047354 [Homalodisca vitripennis]|nr:hypothetical protein J6590_047354 [Homalodisca vitripennis]